MQKDFYREKQPMLIFRYIPFVYASTSLRPASKIIIRSNRKGHVILFPSVKQELGCTSQGRLLLYNGIMGMTQVDPTGKYNTLLSLSISISPIPFPVPPCPCLAPPPPPPPFPESTDLTDLGIDFDVESSSSNHL